MNVSDMGKLNPRCVKVLPKRVYDYACDEDFEACLNDSSVLSEGKNSVVEGVVKSIGSRFVIMDISMKNDGRVHIDEFRISKEFEDLAVGNRYEVFIETLEDTNGYVALSREKALKLALWPQFMHAKENNETVEGTICGKIKGGLIANIMGVLAFLPGSQVGLKSTRDLSGIVGTKQPFHIISLDDNTKNVVISRRSVFEASRLNIQDQTLANIHEGQILEGVVKNLTKYGAFIELSAFVDGLLHLTDISWRRILHPSELLSVGQKVKVQVIKINREARRVSLGMKQLTGNPWQDIVEHYKPGDKLTGLVTNTTDYGVFVEIKPGIEGLVYISEISWVKSASGQHPNALFKKGQEIEVMILSIEQDRHRISLSIKQCHDNPWIRFSELHKIGDIVEGVVNNMTDFGVFITLDGKVDGLVHVSDISWNGDQQTAFDLLQRNQTVKAKILSIDIKKGRVGLGIKQVEYDPLEKFIARTKVGDIVSCKVVGAGNDHLSVSVLEDRDVIIQINGEDFGDDINKVAFDSVLELRVIAVNPDLRQIVLSQQQQSQE